MFSHFGLLILSIFVSINAVSSRIVKRDITWTGNWAFACDFRGNDLTNTQIRGEECSTKCSQTSGCTHFTWTTYNGGTCWMKSGTVSKNDAFSTSDQSMVCGVLDSTVVPNGQRIFRINNQCSQKLWIGLNGHPLVSNGGFEVNARSTMDIQVPDKWVSGRIWARTGCQWIDGKFKCATGDCGTPSNGFGIGCQGISGQPPATLAEFTLNGWGGSDFYDLSNVDGYSIGMSIRPIPGQFTSVNNPSLGKYNCGTATCKFDINRCPPELQMDDGTGAKVCASICAAINNAQQRAKFVHLQNIYNNPDTRSLVCCSCDGNHCVSPYDNITPGGKCYVEQWPRSTQNTRYDQVFKSQCPDAYSWQFDDNASTYQCTKANYEIVFCP